MTNVLFFETEGIETPENSIIFDQMETEGIFFSYFQVDDKYYLICYNKTRIVIKDSLYQSIIILQELNKKQRKIRSFRGFFLYALEIMKNGNKVKIIKTNCPPSFWNDVENIIQQNRKKGLFHFLFGDDEAKIGKLENKINFLQKRIIHLEKEGSNAPTKKTTPIKYRSLNGIPKNKKIEIIQRGFELKNEHKISLQKYYESDETDSLFQSEGFSIKYESIRRLKLYRELNTN